MPSFYTIFALLLLFSMRAWSACPAVISPKDFVTPLPNTPMGRIHLFSFHIDRGKRPTWQEEPVQVDPIDDDGRFIFYQDPSALLTDHLEKKDRISFDAQAFGQKFMPGSAFPCKARRLYELADGRDATKRFVYLAVCNDGSSDRSNDVFPVSHHHLNREVKTDFYSFYYSNRNHILFDKIVLHPPHTDKSLKVAEHSQIRLHANMRNFFNLNFDSHDLVSRIEAERPGKVSFIGFAAFYLKILFLSIDLKLYTGISFLPKTVSIPMVMHMPRNAGDWVNPGSGIMYWWQYDPKVVTYTYDPTLMPKFDAALVKNDMKALIKLGLNYCQPSGDCVYRLPGRVDQYDFTMDFILPRSIVSMGFFPMYTEDPDHALLDLKWESKPADDRRTQVGIYYESSLLQAGEHHWDFWIRMATAGQDLAQVCPHPLKVTRDLIP